MRILLLALFLLPLIAVERIAPPTAPQPSKNQGRAGTYQVPTTIGAYNYYVCVPASSDGTTPFGLHLFFHGQNGQGGAKHFGGWQKLFLESHRLIGINMEYTDGDNGKDTEGKVKAAQEAIAQVTADYKIVQRGAVASFSGGGLPHGLMTEQFAKTRSAQWPFCHSTLYSSNFFRDPTSAVPMSWCITIGTEEWALADLGRTAVTRAGELYQATVKGGTPDIRFVMTRKGHTIPGEDVSASEKTFALSDLAFGAFLYAPDFAEKELRTIVEQANRQQPSAAGVALAKLLAKPTLDAAVKTKGEALQTQITKRLDHIAAALATLPTEDPVLATYYGPVLLAQLKGDAREKDLKTTLVGALKTKEAQATLAAHAELAKHWIALFGGGSNQGIVPDKRALADSLAPHLPATSRAGANLADIIAAGK
ncbi:MAG: hypothetical protein H0W78_14160 [Planctomycetes bacterium]|nr:hypothetical protein [Planctomycetota bacterium]